MKKLISIILVMTALLTMLNFPAYAKADSADFQEAYQLLRTVGIIPNIPNDKLEKGVSRADFAIYAANIINVPAGYNSTKKYYNDVPADHWALDSINALTECRALTVGEDKCFKPSQEITLQEAVKIMLSLAGYGEFALAKGGFPEGFMKIAYERDLTDGISTSGTFTLKDAIILIYNAVNMEMLETYAVSGEGVKYATDKNTLLSTYHDVYYIEDYVNGIYGITLNDKQAPENNEVMLGETIYSCQSSDMYPYLGMYVKAYYKDNEASLDEIIYIKSVDYKNEYMDINTEDINGFNPSDYSLSYQDKNDNQRSVKLSYGVNIVRNGEIQADNIETALSSFGQGNVRLVDTERDGVYDTVLISEYIDMVVGHIDYENQIAYDKYDPSIFVCFEEKNDNSAMLYTAGGGASKIEALSLGSIVTVFKSEGYARAYYSDTTVKGKISEKVTDDDGTVIAIASNFGGGSTQYRIEKNYLSRSGEVPSVGMQATAKLDIYGRIAYLELQESDMMYGYLIHQGNKGALNQTLQLKIFTEEGIMRVLDCAERVIVDGESEKKPADILTAIRKTKDEGDLSVEQVIRFSVNDEGQIREIDTCYGGGKNGNDKLYISHPFESRRYSSRSIRFGTTALIGTSTVIFGVPVVDDITLADEEDFSIIPTSFFTNSTSYNVEAYKTRAESGFEGALLYKGSMQKPISTGTEMFLISSIRYELNDDGDYVEAVYGSSVGTMLTYLTSDEFSFTEQGYESGDIVRLITNTKGEVTDAVCVYKYEGGQDPNLNSWIEVPEGETPSTNFWEDGRFKTVSTANAWSSFTVAYANVVSTNDNVLKLSRTGYTLDDVDEVLKISNEPAVVVYDKSNAKNKVYNGTISDLVPGVSAGSAATKAFVRTEESNIRWIVVYK